MYCDDCGAPVELDLTEYIKQREATGTVICTTCRDSFLQRVAREEAMSQA